MGETGASTSDGFSLRGRLFLLEARPTYTGSTVTEVPCSPITQAKQRKWPLVWSRGSGKFACRDTEKSLGGAGWRGQRPALGKAGSGRAHNPPPPRGTHSYTLTGVPDIHMGALPGGGCVHSDPQRLKEPETEDETHPMDKKQFLPGT